MTELARLRGVALDLAARGWPVFPLWPGSKVPALHSTDECPRTGTCTAGHRTPEQRASADPALIAAAWTRPYNVGIACGPAGLVVVDLDVPKGTRTASGLTAFDELCTGHGLGCWPDTMWVDTPSGGVHLYFTAPPGVQLRNTAGLIGPGIDTRAHGGYVVAPGSVLAAGPRQTAGPYRTATDSPARPVELPGWLTDLLAPAPLPPARPSVVVLRDVARRSAWLEAAVRRQLDHLTSAPDGQRNQALYVSAVALGQLAAGGALTERDVYDLLTQACLSRRWRAKPSTIASGLRAGSRRPRTVPA